MSEWLIEIRKPESLDNASKKIADEVIEDE